MQSFLFGKHMLISAYKCLYVFVIAGSWQHFTTLPPPFGMWNAPKGDPYQHVVPCRFHVVQIAIAFVVLIVVVIVVLLYKLLALHKSSFTQVLPQNK